jgi:hypothetical protein
MAQVMTTSVVRQIGSLFDGGSVAGLTDRQLIERFVDNRDPDGEAAFAAIVTRHGPMVLGVCRQLLGDHHHAEDAFQAVFLVLARKAGSIRDPDLLGNWLYGVALRTSRKARAAMDFTAGQAASSSAAALAQEVLRAMLIHKLKFLALTLLLLGAVATGAGYLAHALALSDEPRKSPAGPQTPAAAKPDEVDTKPAPGRMFVVGRVLDPQGKPVPGATIAAHARHLAPGIGLDRALRGQVQIGEARADGSGRFRLDAPRTSASGYDRFGAIALAPGHGTGWVDLDPDDDQPAADITLPPEQVIHGRLFDLQGQPVPNVTLSVSSIRRVLPQDPARARRQLDAVVYWGTKIKDFPAWPKPVMTDPEGRFTLRGLGQDRSATLTVHHPRFALQSIPVETDRTSKSKPLTAALVPAQILSGRVSYADTGEGVPHALLDTESGGAETDDDGRFRINPAPADGYYVRAYPPAGQPYLIASKRLTWPKGALEQSLDIALPRGVLVHGKVTEEGSGKPVPGAFVQFVSHAEPHNGVVRPIIIVTASDGSFQLGARPSTGHLFIRGPSDDYLLQAIGDRMYDNGQPGGRRVYAHAIRFLDLKPGTDSQEVDLALRRGATVTGRVVGPDGQPVGDAWFFSRVTLAPTGVWREWTGRDHGRVRDGRFEVHGLDPDTEVPVYFLDPRRKLGAVINLSGKSASGGPVTVRLQPCGAARARVVGPGGKPVVGRLHRRLDQSPGTLNFEMVVTPGPPSTTAKGQADLLSADEMYLTVVDPINYDIEQVFDADGRITLPGLIPGATYRCIDHTAVIPGEAGPEIRKEFTVKPGETLDLGEVRIEKPPV